MIERLEKMPLVLPGLRFKTCTSPLLLLSYAEISELCRRLPTLFPEFFQTRAPLKLVKDFGLTDPKTRKSE